MNFPSDINLGAEYSASQPVLPPPMFAGLSKSHGGARRSLRRYQLERTVVVMMIKNDVSFKPCSSMDQSWLLAFSGNPACRKGAPALCIPRAYLCPLVGEQWPF